MKKFIKDYVWDLWFLLPKCRRERARYERDARERFDYEKNSDMSLITTNCLGAEIYHILGLQFRTSIVNISMDRNHLVQLALEPRAFFSSSLEFVGRNKRGEWIANLTSVDSGTTIQMTFPHEKDKDQIYKNFERRKERVNYNNLYYITDDCGLTEESYRIFGDVECTNKLILTAKDLSDKYPYTHQLKTYAGRETVGKYQNKTRNGIFKFQEIWDFVEWFNNSKLSTSRGKEIRYEN